jgi:hypothetical protein
MVDQKEFFAEMSVTYLSNGYHELDKANKKIMEDCSPPLLQPVVTERVLKQHGLEEEPLQQQSTFPWFPQYIYWNREMRGTKPKLRIVNPILQEHAIARSCLDVIHCNKFYPFTRGQLKQHDPKLFSEIQELWREIIMWDDPDDDRTCCRSLRQFLPPFVG